MPKTPFTLADSLSVTGWQLVDSARKLEAGSLSARELRQVGELLADLAEAVTLYAEKLDVPPRPLGGRHALREPDEPPPAA